MKDCWHQSWDFGRWAEPQLLSNFELRRVPFPLVYGCGPPDEIFLTDLFWVTVRNKTWTSKGLMDVATFLFMMITTLPLLMLLKIRCIRNLICTSDHLRLAFCDQRVNGSLAMIWNIVGTRAETPGRWAEPQLLSNFELAYGAALCIQYCLLLHPTCTLFFLIIMCLSKVFIALLVCQL